MSGVGIAAMIEEANRLEGELVKDEAVETAPKRMRDKKRGGSKQSKKLRVKRQKLDNPKQSKARDSTTAFVSNLAYTVTEEEIREMFKNCGKVVEVRIGSDKSTEKPKGYAHVQFENEDGVREAVALWNQKLQNKRCLSVVRAGENVSFSLPEEMKTMFVELLTGWELEGKNLSYLKHAWECEHKQPLNVKKFGFKNMKCAIQSIPEIRLDVRNSTVVAFLRNPDEAHDECEEEYDEECVEEDEEQDAELAEAELAEAEAAELAEAEAAEAAEAEAAEAAEAEAKAAAAI